MRTRTLAAILLALTCVAGFRVVVEVPKAPWVTPQSLRSNR